MTIAFKPDETYRDSFTFRNSDAAILRFPFPFPEDKYMYSVNIEPHVRGGFTPVYSNPFDVDEHYIAECRERAITLERDPSRYAALPHMMPAQWDALQLIMESLSGDYPDLFTLSRDGDRWTWVNRPLGIEQSFTFGKEDTLPYEPLEYISRQAQGDFAILDERDETFYLDAGMVTTQADWSLQFDVGMNFFEWHTPVPLAAQAGVFDRAMKFLLRLRVGQPMRRLNWTMTVNPRLDTAPESFPEWGPDRTSLTLENIGRKLHLRVELQTLYRLPRTNAVLFPLRCFLISLDELARVPKWGKRLHRVLSTLPRELVEYKGLSRYLPTAIEWLSKYDDGTPTSEGCGPDIASL